jgi:hypothetical protein
MKVFLNTVGNMVDRIVWAVGCFAIFDYAFEHHWNLAVSIVSGVLIAGFGGWFFWQYFVVPFRAGWRGETEGSRKE